jgi:hypothetical protein
MPENISNKTAGTVYQSKAAHISLTESADCSTSFSSAVNAASGYGY